jgi:hypothetical protein
MQRKHLKNTWPKNVKSHPDAALQKCRAGGKTNSNMLKHGRNMAKVINQRSSGRGG